MLGRDPRLLALQGRLIAAVAPFAASRGSASSFVTDPEEAGVNATTLDYVAHFVPDHCASHYEAHVSIGLARRRDLEAVEAEPFEPFDGATGGRGRLPARQRRDGPPQTAGVAGAGRAGYASEAASQVVRRRGPGRHRRPALGRSGLLVAQ